jgi:hypothetical protein
MDSEEFKIKNAGEKAKNDKETPNHNTSNTDKKNDLKPEKYQQIINDCLL